MPTATRMTTDEDGGEGLIRLIALFGFLALPILMLFVHLILIYRS